MGGRMLSDHLGSEMPMGLIEQAVGGSPIEYWISPEAIAACEVDEPQCDDKKDDSVFYHEKIQPLFPFTLGAVIWDQAERDVKCPVSLAAYPCMQKQLISTWRDSFASSFAFVAVQLHGYTAALNNGTGSYEGGVTAEMVYNMRLAQEEGIAGVDSAAIVPSYDLSCPTSPFSSVHIPDKADVGARVALQLRRLMGETSLVAEGPRATAATAEEGRSGFEVSVAFSGGSGPFELRGTRNCTSCCDGAHSVDMDVSADGLFWVNGTVATLSSDGRTLSFRAALPGGERPRHVRHTAASIWPQCALYNGEGLPAMPFRMDIESPELVV